MNSRYYPYSGYTGHDEHPSEQSEVPRKKQQAQIQLDERKLKQYQDQTFSNNNMASLFCTLETIAFQLKGKNLNDMKFKTYDFMAFGKKKTLPELYDQAGIQLNLFFTSIQLYTKKYKKYDYPNDFSPKRLNEFLQSLNKHSPLQPYVKNLFHMFNNEYTKVNLSFLEKKPEKKAVNIFTTEKACQFMGIIRTGVDEMNQNIQRQYEADPEGMGVSLEGSIKPFTDYNSKQNGGSHMHRDMNENVKENGHLHQSNCHNRVTNKDQDTVDEDRGFHSTKNRGVKERIDEEFSMRSDEEFSMRSDEDKALEVEKGKYGTKYLM